MGLTREQRMSRTNACVYFIRDPETNAVRYIGATTNPRLRMSQHMSSPYANPKLRNWAKQLIASGKRPVMDIVLSGLRVEVAERVEHRLIVLHSDSGNLLQMTYRIEDGKEVRNLGGNCLCSYVGAAS